MYLEPPMTSSVVLVYSPPKKQGPNSNKNSQVIWVSGVPPTIVRNGVTTTTNGRKWMGNWGNNPTFGGILAALWIGRVHLVSWHLVQQQISHLTTVHLKIRSKCSWQWDNTRKASTTRLLRRHTHQLTRSRREMKKTNSWIFERPTRKHHIGEFVELDHKRKRSELPTMGIRNWSLLFCLEMEPYRILHLLRRWHHCKTSWTKWLRCWPICSRMQLCRTLVLVVAVVCLLRGFSCFFQCRLYGFIPTSRGNAYFSNQKANGWSRQVVINPIVEVRYPLWWESIRIPYPRLNDHPQYKVMAKVLLGIPY